MDLSALGYIVGGLVAATKASQSPQLYTAVRTGIYLTHDQIYIDLGDYYPGYLWKYLASWQANYVGFIYSLGNQQFLPVTSFKEGTSTSFLHPNIEKVLYIKKTRA